MTKRSKSITFKEWTLSCVALDRVVLAGGYWFVTLQNLTKCFLVDVELANQSTWKIFGAWGGRGERRQIIFWRTVRRSEKILATPLLVLVRTTQQCQRCHSTCACLTSIYLSQLFDRGKKLEESLAKLEQERQRSDQLLYRMMPKAVADRLKDGQKAIETCEVLVCLCFQSAGNARVAHEKSFWA